MRTVGNEPSSVPNFSLQSGTLFFVVAVCHFLLAKNKGNLSSGASVQIVNRSRTHFFSPFFLPMLCTRRRPVRRVKVESSFRSEHSKMLLRNDRMLASQSPSKILLLNIVSVVG